MALSGSFSNYPTTYLGLYCEWSATQNVSNNTSSVTLNVYLKYYSLYVGARDNGKVSINGTSTTYSSPAISEGTNTWNTKLLKTYTVSVPHNSDGTKSCALSASWSFNGTYSGVSIGTITASTTVTLDTIARASSISSASNVTLGNACSVSWTPASSSFKYKVKFVLGNWNYTTDYINPNRTTSYTYTGYTIPVNVSAQLPNATTGTMTAYLYTYNGTTQIGSTASKTFTVTVPSSVVPTVSSVSVSLVNSNTTIDGWGIAVAGYTKVRVTASASGAQSSTIKSFTISGGYSTTQDGTSLSYTGGVISTSGSKTFTVKAKDSRSRESTGVISSAVTYYAYSKPSISSFTAARSSSNSQQVVVKANWSYASVNSKNSATAKLYYKRSTATSWTNYGDITSSKNSNLTLSGVTFNDAYSYNFKVEVTDALGNKVQEEEFVSTVAVLMDFRAGGQGLGIGKIAESNSLEVALPTIFMDSVKIRIGSSDITLKNYIEGVMNGTYT